MFAHLVLTNSGVDIMSSLTTGVKVSFNTIQMGSGGMPPDIQTVTALQQHEQSVPITRLIQNLDNTVTIGGNLMGEDVSSGFNWTEVGIFAKRPTDASEILVAYGNAGNDGSYIPAGGVVTEQLIDFIINISSSAIENIVVDSSLMFITKEIYDADLVEMDTNKLNVSAKATKAEAEAGTNNTKYTTPLNVIDSIKKNAVQATGEIILKIQSTQPAPISGKTIIWIDTSS